MGTLKGQMGAPTDVNIQAGPSPADGVVTNLQARPTPAAQQQAAQAQAVAVAPAPAQPPPVAPGMVEKDRAIAEQAARIKELEGNNQFLDGKMTELIKAQTQAPPPPPPEPEKPPPGFETLPAEDQMRWYAKQEAKAMVGEALTKYSEDLKASIGPMLGKVVEHDANLMEQNVRRRFPNLPYEDYRVEFDKLAAVMPAMDAIERAASVVVKAGHPEYLMPAEAALPVVERALPSMSAAAGQPHVRQEQTGPTRGQELAAAASMQRQNRGLQAAQHIENVLRSHVQTQRRADAIEQQRRMTGG